MFSIVWGSCLWEERERERERDRQRERERERERERVFERMIRKHEVICILLDYEPQNSAVNTIRTKQTKVEQYD